MSLKQQLIEYNSTKNDTIYTEISSIMVQEGSFKKQKNILLEKQNNF